MNAGLALPAVGILGIGIAVGALAFALRAVAVWRSRRDRERLAESSLLGWLVPPPPAGWPWLRAGLLAFGTGAVAAAAAGAAAGKPAEEIPGGPETVLVLDASNSMLAEDVEPNRLRRQRAVALSLLGRLGGQVGIVYFAGGGYILSPLTTDLDAVLMFVEAVRPASVGRGGSALAAGLEEALDVLAGGEESAHRSIVLFSDGEETVGQPVEEAVRRATRDAVRVFAVGVGTRDGGRIPLGRDAALGPLPLPGGPPGRRAFLRDADGREVVTHLEEEALRRIAGSTGGAYFSATEEGMDRLAQRIQMADGGGPHAPLRGTPGLLLLVGFALLWTEGFLFRAG